MSMCEYNIDISAIIQILASIFAGGSLIYAVAQYKISLFSQKFQNAQTLVQSFYKSLKEGDVQSFKEIIMLRGESAGGDNKGHYQDEQGNLQNFSNYFTEGPTDGGRLDCIVNNLERVCYFSKKENIDIEFFYSELGQFISICHEILLAMSIDYNESVKTGETMSSDTSGFENIDRCFNEMMKTKTPIKIIGYIE